MRFALSAAAAASGLLLLGLALFGQPDVYLRQARDALDNLTEPAPAGPDRASVEAVNPPATTPPAVSQPAVSQPAVSLPAASQPAVSQPAASQPSAAMTASIEQLQQQVLQLRDELAARREEADRAREAVALAQAQQQAAQAQAQAAQVQAQQQAAQVQAQQQAAQVLEQQQAAQAQAQQQAVQAQAQQQAAQAQAQAQQQAAHAQQVQQAAEAQRQATEAQRQAAEQPPAFASEMSAAPTKGAAESPLPPAADRREPPAPAERRVAASKPIQKPAPRQEAENAQSVLARLRQAAPVTAFQPDAAQPPERINRGPSPALRRLIAARTALGNGQVEETRRLLQEAQLQLVFRPVGSAEEETGSSGRTASNVAHALDALSGNDMALSRSYIDRAVDDASGSPVDPAHGEASEPPTGYAPGYAPGGPAPGYAPAYPVR